MEQVFGNRWTSYFFNIALVVASQSKDPSTKVGAVIVDSNKRIIATGYNGFPRGYNDDYRLYQDRSFKYPHICHAEANAICQAASTGVSLMESSIFITLNPCIECAKLLIQSGIKSVHYLTTITSREKEKEFLNDPQSNWRKFKIDAIKLLLECGVSVAEYNDIHRTTNVDNVAIINRYQFSLENVDKWKGYNYAE